MRLTCLRLRSSYNGLFPSESLALEVRLVDGINRSDSQRRFIRILRDGGLRRDVSRISSTAPSTIPSRVLSATFSTVPSFRSVFGSQFVHDPISIHIKSVGLSGPSSFGYLDYMDNSGWIYLSSERKNELATIFGRLGRGSVEIVGLIVIIMDEVPRTSGIQVGGRQDGGEAGCRRDVICDGSYGAQTKR
jgi:hypothetical protein